MVTARAVTKPVYVILESKDNLRSAPLRDATFDLLAVAVARYGHGFSTVARNYGELQGNVAALSAWLRLMVGAETTTAQAARRRCCSCSTTTSTWLSPSPTLPRLWARSTSTPPLWTSSWRTWGRRLAGARARADGRRSRAPVGYGSRSLRPFREVAKMKFQTAESARTYATFLPRLAEKAPRLVNKQMSLLIQHLDNEVRCGALGGAAAVG